MSGDRRILMTCHEMHVRHSSYFRNLGRKSDSVGAFGDVGDPNKHD